MEKMINKRTYNHSVAFWDPRTPTTSVDEEGDRFRPRRKRWCRSLPCWYKQCQGSQPSGVGRADEASGRGKWLGRLLGFD
ncbi:hypothetical protein E1A91_A10G189900v1 [Gossypium mustelinum]|uniref:Uncharacterized protein n=1 Tax=Gossypium mustelinum TaxID=34275 RepID=A0A5D2XNW3_GOSMU|nr:hypothetical protein E1A91_A10G189900v1 [Gossypium mustelinum]